MKTGALIFGAKGLSLAIPIFWKDLVNTLTGLSVFEVAISYFG